MSTDWSKENAASQLRSGKLLLGAGIFAFAALLATGFFMTLSQGDIMFLKALIAKIPGCGGLF